MHINDDGGSSGAPGERDLAASKSERGKGARNKQHAHLLLASGCTLAADSHLGLELLKLLGIHALTSAVHEAGRARVGVRATASGDVAPREILPLTRGNRRRPAGAGTGYGATRALSEPSEMLEKMEAYPRSLASLRQSLASGRPAATARRPLPPRDRRRKNAANYSKVRSKKVADVIYRHFNYRLTINVVKKSF